VRKLPRFNRSGFSLIELLIVIVLIGILTATVAAILNPARVRRTAGDAALKASINKLGLDVQGYISSYGVSPNEYQFLNSLKNTGKIDQKDGVSCEITGSPDDECLFDIKGIDLPDECDDSEWEGVGSNHCYFRFKARVFNEDDRFRVYVRSLGQADTLFVFDNKDHGRIRHCPVTLSDADGLETCGIVDIVVADGDGTGDSGGGSGDGGGGVPPPDSDGTTDFIPSDTTPQVDPLSILNVVLPEGDYDQYYRTTLLGSGGEPPYTWSILSGSLPEDLDLDGVTGVLSGTPSSGGIFTLLIQLKDKVGRAISRAFQLIINPENPPDVPPGIPPENIILTGRFVDSFTKEPVPNVFFTSANYWNNRHATVVGNQPDGTFTISMSFDPLTTTQQIIFPYTTQCYFFYDYMIFTRNGDNTITLEIKNIDGKENESYDIEDTAFNIGDIEMRKGLTSGVISNSIMRVYIHYPGDDYIEDGSKSDFIKYGSQEWFPPYVALLDYPLKYEIVTEDGRVFNAPEYTVPRNSLCTDNVYLKFFNGVFEWIQVPRGYPLWSQPWAIESMNVANGSAPPYVP